VETPKYIVNSLLYSTLAVAGCVVVGVPIAWILARTRLPGRDTLDGLNTLILALPGTAIGIAYIRAFHFPCRGSTSSSPVSGSCCRLVLCIRRLPYTVRGAYASLLLVHRSMEEAAASVGATELRSFRDVTLPLIWRGVLVGSAVLVRDLAAGGLGGGSSSRWAAGRRSRSGSSRSNIAGSANEAAARA